MEAWKVDCVLWSHARNWQKQHWNPHRSISSQISSSIVFVSCIKNWAPFVAPGEKRQGNGNPLQYSCLENSMDGEAWWATVHGVAKSRTRLSDFTSLHLWPLRDLWLLCWEVLTCLKSKFWFVQISKSLMFLFEIYVLTVGLWVLVSLHFESPLSRLACGGRECFSVWSLQVTMEYRGTEQVVT